VGLFNKELLASEGVLSSHSIQKRFTEMSIRAKRKSCEIPEKIKILTEESNIIPEEPPENSGDLPQSKVKKSKVKKSKVLGAVAPTPEQISFFKNFEKWISDHAPNVGKMKEPFTIEQYLKLKEKFSYQQIKTLLLKMHNHKPLLQKNVCAYLTFLNWMERDIPKTETTQHAGIARKLEEEKAAAILNS